MNRRLLFLLAAAPLFSPAVLRAADPPQLSGAKLDLLDERGYFTPEFKAAIHDLVDAKNSIASATVEEKKLRQSLPGLQGQNAGIQTQVIALHKELALYEHPEDSDYDALQNAMKDPARSPGERLAMAQAFVWSYPADPRQAEAEQDLRQIQKQMADQTQAARDAETARLAARAKLEQRAAARQLSLAEWRGFLRDMSQEDLLARFGPPQNQGQDYWIYTGAWTTDPATQAKAGLRIDFNGTRVMDVMPAPP